MKVPPKKPHFFKPIIPGFKDKFKIPKGFLKHLKGHEDIGRAILKRNGKKWLVKLNGRGLEDGWKKFAEELNLQLGDLLIFRHEGDMEFEVSIFDSSCCEREYGAEENVRIPEETSEKFEFKAEKRNTSIELSGKVSYHTEAATHKPFRCSHFVFTIKPYCLTYGFLYVPKHFAYANGLIANKKCGLIVKDETQRSWNLRISSCKTQVYIGDGCRKFIADNCLKKGDRIMFEVVTDGETPIWKFHVVTYANNQMRKFHAEKSNTSIKSSIKASSHGKIAAHKPFGHSSFVCTIKPYCLTYCVLYVPKHFAYANGLIANKKYGLIIIDETQRSWNLRISSRKTHVCIGEGCRKFIADNCLKEGDRIMFEVVSDGAIPIWKFHVVTEAETPMMRKFQDLRGSPFLQPEVKKKHLDAERMSDKETSDVTTLESQVAASTSADANPHFISSIKPYTRRVAVLYLPMAFVKSNGLLDRRQLIVVDEKRRSWSMCLGQIDKYHFGIKNGWRKFIKANGVQVGDAYKFELTNNGTIPIVHFHCKYEAVGDGEGN